MVFYLSLEGMLLEKFINIAKEEAIQAMNQGEIPVGAVIVKDGEIIGRGHNLKESLNDVTAHAEIIAIKEAARKIGDWRLNGCEMYVTLEPCPMCSSAIAQSRISILNIGTFNKDMGACGTVFNLFDCKALNYSVKVNWLYDEECLNFIKQFFYKRRKDEK